MTFRSAAVAAAVALLVSACASAPQKPAEPQDEAIPADWLQLPVAARVPALSYDPGGVLLQVAKPADSPVRIASEGGRQKLVAGSKELTPPFPAIDSFDVSMDRREVVFSAKRTDNFDIGLVSLDGSDIHWVPEDPADEVSVQWAPRGNKVSFTVRARGGDLVRTVHVPTAMQLTTDFPFGHVHALAWEPKAERYAVAWSSVDASDRIEVMKYGGEERKLTTPPAVKLDVEVQPAGEALLLHPTAMRYNEKLPLVVWRASNLNEWDDARGSLERSTRVACAVIDHEPDAAFWAAVADIPWIDFSRVYIVGARPATESAPERKNCSGAACAVWITADTSIPAGHYRRNATVVGVPPALVQSFGAAWVAHQLKGNPPANGSHR